jgi:hypothetical protein
MPRWLVAARRLVPTLVGVACFSLSVILQGCTRLTKISAPQRAIELAGNLSALAIASIPAGSYTYHGIKLGDPVTDALSAPGASSDALRGLPTIVWIRDWNVRFDAIQGRITSIELFDSDTSSALANALKVFNPEDVELRFGPDGEEVPIGCGKLRKYPSRHIQVFAVPQGIEGSVHLAVKLTE